MFDIVYPGVVNSFVRAFIAPPHETGKEKHADKCMCLGFRRDRARGEREFMYAIIETGGKQYRVKEGDILRVEKLPFEPGETLEFDSGLACAWTGMTLRSEVPCYLRHTCQRKCLHRARAERFLVFKYKPKKNYRKRYGHRQPYTEIQIEKIQV